MYNKENLARIRKMNSLAPAVMTAFWAFDAKFLWNYFPACSSNPRKSESDLFGAAGLPDRTSYA